MTAMAMGKLELVYLMEWREQEEEEEEEEVWRGDDGRRQVGRLRLP